MSVHKYRSNLVASDFLIPGTLANSSHHVSRHAACVIELAASSKLQLLLYCLLKVFATFPALHALHSYTQSMLLFLSMLLEPT